MEERLLPSHPEDNFQVDWWVNLRTSISKEETDSNLFSPPAHPSCTHNSGDTQGVCVKCEG